MDRSAIVGKTEKGDDEILTRQNGLAKELRRVLILVDGKSSVEQLAEKGRGWDVEGGLVALAKGGYVDIGGMSPGVLDADIEAIRVQLVSIAQEVLGGDAGKVVEKLQAAPDTREGLLEAVGQCKKLVRLMIDEKKASKLQERCQGALAVLAAD